MNLVPGAIVPARYMKVPQVLQKALVIVCPLPIVFDCAKFTMLSSPRVKRVWVSSVVRFVANIEALIFRQSEQWHTKVLSRPGPEIG